MFSLRLLVLKKRRRSNSGGDDCDDDVLLLVVVVLDVVVLFFASAEARFVSDENVSSPETLSFWRRKDLKDGSFSSDPRDRNKRDPCSPLNTSPQRRRRD